MKKGDSITLYFKAMEIVSESQVEVIDVDGEFIIISDSWHSDKSGEEENGKFNKKTGKCVNDNTFMGSCRYIKI